MRWWARSVLVVGLAAAGLWLVDVGLDNEPGSSPGTEPAPAATTTATTEPPATTTTTAGERPAEALAEGVEQTVHDRTTWDTLHLEPVDVAVLGAAIALGIWILIRRRASSGPVTVTVVDGTAKGTGDTGDGGGEGTGAPSTDAIAALVRDRLGRVNLTPPTAVPAAGDASPSEGIISVFEAFEPTKPAGAVARALAGLNPARRRGYAAHVVLRRSDTTDEAGATVELSDLDAGVTLPATTLWAGTFEAAARHAAFQIATVLLERLSRRERRRLWWRWESSGRSLQAFEDAGWEIDHRRYERAIQRLEEGLEVDPGNLALRLRLGQTFERLHCYEEALLTYQIVFDRSHRIDRRHAHTKEAGLIRWRAAVVLSNGERWGPAWARRVVDAYGAPRPGVHNPDNRVQALLATRYRPAMRREFRTLFGTLLADDRSAPLAAPGTRPGLPELHHNAPLNRVRVRRDRGPGPTFAAIEAELIGHQPQDAQRLDARLLAVDAAVRAALSAGQVRRPEKVRRARAALSVEQFLWRAAQVEACEIGWRLRRRSGLSLYDVRVLVDTVNLKRLDDAGAFWTTVGLQLRAALTWARLARTAAVVPVGRARSVRAQVQYNTACCQALALARTGTGGSWDRAEVDARVRQVVDLIGQACTGHHNLIEQGAARWIVYEDPDLGSVRTHRLFCRFAKSTLYLEITPREVAWAHAVDRHELDLVEGATGAAVAVWRTHVATPPDRRTLVAALRADADLHLAIAALVRTPSRSARLAVADATRALTDDERLELPGWPVQARPVVAGDGHRWPPGLDRWHAAAADSSRSQADALQSQLDGLRRWWQLPVHAGCRPLLHRWCQASRALDGLEEG